MFNERKAALDTNDLTWTHESSLFCFLDEYSAAPPIDWSANCFMVCSNFEAHRERKRWKWIIHALQVSWIGRPCWTLTPLSIRPQLCNRPVSLVQRKSCIKSQVIADIIININDSNSWTRPSTTVINKNSMLLHTTEWIWCLYVSDWKKNLHQCLCLLTY